MIHQGFTKNPVTAKEWSYSAVFTGAVMLLTGAAGLTVALTVNKRRKAHK